MTKKNKTILPIKMINLEKKTNIFNRPYLQPVFIKKKNFNFRKSGFIPISDAIFLYD